MRPGDLELQPLDFEKPTRVTGFRICTLTLSVVGFSVLMLRAKQTKAKAMGC